MSYNAQEYKFVSQCLTDTGFLARQLLGYNYDEDAATGRKVNVGKGGIVDHGKTKEIITLLDSDLQFVLIKAPRESRKSTILQAFCVRQILRNKNVRICYIGRTDGITLGKALAIRAQLEREEVVALFGPQKGSKWEETEFTVVQRDAIGLQNATFTAFSMDSFPTGGRFDFVILDDFIDHTNVNTPEQNKKSKEKWAMLQPFMAAGGRIIVVGTTWADDDLYAILEASPLFQPPNGGSVICGAGVRVITDTTGKLDLEVADGGITFPHLTVDYLRKKLHGMALEGKVDHFCRQYLNEATSRSTTAFHRTYFQPLMWGDDMQALSGYLLTDTATSMEDEGCYSVIAYAGLDASDNLYLLDLRVGHWEADEFKDQFFDVLEDWQKRVNHCGEAWEKIALTTAYRSAIESDSRARKTRLRTIEMPRPPKSQKWGRIMRLQPVMRNKHFYVVNTVPRTFIDVDGTKPLWNPEGHFDTIFKRWVASGELVDEFVKANAKRDIPDALAMILEYEKIGNNRYRRLCAYKPYTPRKTPASLTEQRKSDYHASEYHHPANGDWWESTLRDNGY